MSTAERCTGGSIAHLITSPPSSSAYFSGSVVSYDNAIKQRILNVSTKTLQTAGAVSEATVQQMARSVLEIMQTDYAIAVSGIMGPDGGTPEKPVGMVWIAVASKEKVLAKQFNFRFDRRRNIELTSTYALNLLRIFMLSNG